MTTEKLDVELPVPEETTPLEDLQKRVLELTEESKALHRELNTQRAEVLKVRVDAEQARVAAKNTQEALLQEVEDKTAEVFRTKTEAQQTLLSTQAENERLLAENKRKSAEIARSRHEAEQTITGLENLDKARTKDIQAKINTITELKNVAEEIRATAEAEKSELRKEIEAREADIFKIQADIEQTRVNAEMERDAADTAKSELQIALRDDYSVVGYKRVLKMIAEAEVQYMWNGFEFGHALVNKRGEWLGAAGPVFQSAARLILDDPSQEVTWDLPREAYSK